MKHMFTLLLICPPLFCNAQTYNQLEKIVAADRGAGDKFGTAVDIDYNYAVVGALFDSEDENGTDTLAGAGAAYVFERSGNTWIQVQKLVASDRAVGDKFGVSVSISGNIIIVGADNEDEDVSGSNPLSDAGSVYFFERDGSGTWIEVQKCVSSDRNTADLFGNRVSISENYALIGAVQEDEDENGTNTLNTAGSAYFFHRDINGNWSQVQKVVASDRDPNDRFANDLDIFGGYAVVAAFSEDHDVNGNNFLSNAGSAYIFEFNGSTWQEVRKVVASDRDADDRFGKTVAIDNSFVIVGANKEDEDPAGGNTITDAGSAYIYTRDTMTGNWSEIQKIVSSDRAADDKFASYVAINGAYIVAGAFTEDEDENGLNTLLSAGSAYIFNFDTLDAQWTEIQKIVPDERFEFDQFAASVAISNGTILAGVPQEDEDVNAANTIPEAGGAYFFDICVRWVTIYPNSCAPYVSPAGNVYDTTGVYHDTLANSVGCDSIITINLSITGLDTSVTQPNQITLMATQTATTYQWVDCQNGFAIIPGASGQSFVATNNGSYAVILDPGNCADTSACYQINGVGINPMTKNPNISLYPNPVGDMLYIKSDQPTYGGSLIITDTKGRRVCYKDLNHEGGVQVSVSQLSPGIYYLILQNNKTCSTTRFIKR